LIRYICLVGPVLLGLLFLLGEADQQTPASPASARWTSVDALRAMAHLGEPVHGRDRDARFVHTAIISSARAASPQLPRTELENPAASPKPSAINAQASMDAPKLARARAAKTPKPRVAPRPARARTAVAENAQRPMRDEFGQPSW
jgi:hypothetical protein